MANDKAAEQVESTKLTATKWKYHSKDRVGKHKPEDADGKTMSNVAGSSVGQVAAPQLNGKVVQMSVVKDQTARTEESDSCHNLFNTVELLENVLSKLPIKDLLFAQGVCKTWKNCIEYSKILQQGLFFAPTDLEPIEVRYNRGEFGGYVTVLERTESESAIPGDNFVRSCSNICVNPLLVSAFGYQLLATYLLDEEEIPRGRESFSRPEASWKRMRGFYPPLVFSDVLLPFKQTLQRYELTIEGSYSYPQCRQDVTTWKKCLKKRAHDVISSACEQMQHCDTTEDLDASLRVFKKQRNM